MERRSRLTNLEVFVVRAAHLTEEQRGHVRELQSQCFAEVPYDQLMEDFVAQSVAKVLAYHEGQPVGCVSVFRRSIEHAGRSIVLGGCGGTCTRADLRGRGVGTTVCLAAMDVLRQEGCDAAFLAVGETSGTAAFYERLGFVLLGKPFTFVNARGVTKTPSSDDVGMLAPVCAREVFELVMAGGEPLHLGPEKGYW
ncbi:MAG: GNAT family N-acetyltransferase [Chloroflexi bacterium]|nr:GNAT family N-acetyltransferase [Chloroflexota bacterium]